MAFPQHHTRPGLAVLLIMSAWAASSAAQAADALNGKALYLGGPAGGGATCASCHGASPATNVNGILRAANSPNVIASAISSNKGGMGGLFTGAFSAADLADLAAFIGNPTVTAAPVAALTPSSLAFGGATVGQSSSALSVTVANSGNAALRIDSIGIAGAGAADFSIGGGTCSAGASVAAGASCTVQASFKPTVAGARAATLTVAHNGTGGTSTASLTGTGNAVPQATVGVSATSINFGALLTNSTSALQTVTVNNSGQAPLTFSSIAITGAQAGLFTLGGSCASGTVLAEGASCTVSVSAQPTAAGAFAATLVLASNAANGNASVAMSGSGAAAAPAISVSPASLAFGAQTIASAAPAQTITLTNSGNVPVTFSAIAITGDASVTLGAGCGAALAPGASCTVPVLFTPVAEGSVSASVSARSNAATVTIPVTATGTAAPVAKPALSSAGPIAFVATQVGKTASVRSITLSNSGSAAMKIATLMFGGANASDFAVGGTCAVGASVSAAGSCTIDVSFTPAAAGARRADLVLVTDSGAQFSVPYTGSGIAVADATAVLTLTPQSFDFGATTIGGTALTKRFSLTNSSTSAAVLTKVGFTGPYARVADATGCAAGTITLQPGASCDLVVSFNPLNAGAASGSVVIDAESGASWTIALAGQANAAPVAAVPENRGGGGCSMVRGSNDPMLPLLALLAVVVLIVRRRRRVPA